MFEELDGTGHVLPCSHDGTRRSPQVGGAKGCGNGAASDLGRGNTNICHMVMQKAQDIVIISF